MKMKKNLQIGLKPKNDRKQKIGACWPTTKLNKVAEIKHGFAFKSIYFCGNGDFVLLTPGNFNESGGFRWLGDKQKYYSGDIPNGYVLKKDDLLVAMTEQAPGLLGSAILIPESDRYLHNQRLGLVQINSLHISKYFLFHVFNSFIVRKPISETSAGTKVKHTSPEKIGKLSIPLPPIEHQTAIANLLSTWDAAIEKIERLIAAKEKRFSWLQNTLIYQESSKSKWRKVMLSEISKPITRKNDVMETNVLTSSSQNGLVSQLEYYNKSVSAENLTGYYLLHSGDFAYNRSSSNGYPFGSIKRLDSCNQGVLSTLYLPFSITDKKRCYSDYFVYLFESGYLNRQLRKICQEGARSHGLLNITKSDFSMLKIPIPPIDQQKQIAAKLNTARSEINLLKKQLDAYQRQKRGLMQKLLTGQWRVKVKEN